MKTEQTNFGKCPLTTAQFVLNGKWKLLIIHNISIGNNRFGVLRNELPGCSPSMLTSQLRDLEKDGLIVRTIYPEIPPHVEYSLTETGGKLTNVIHYMAEWGKTYLNDVFPYL